MSMAAEASMGLGGGLAGVQGTIADFLASVERRFEDQLASDLPPVSGLCRHVEHYRGKMLRPTLVALCGLASGDSGRLGADHVTLAAVCEMVHMATLVHDDVLDDADTRRRGRTVNRLHGNEAAVILGDYLIASAYHLCSQLDSQSAALLVGQASMTMCAGELLQLHHRDDFSLDEATYFEIVDRKTAALIGLSCRLGAMASGASDEIAQRLETFGRRLGTAFQIQDDLLDLTGDESTVGKSVGRDLAKGKLTLPMVHHLAMAPATGRGRALELLEVACDDRGGDRAAASARRLAALLVQTGSLEYARTEAARLVAEARDLLTAAVPDSPARQALLEAAEKVVSRAF
jgi:octaprenyl-diphosphate synthase